MLITKLGGIISVNDSSLPAADKVECLFEASAAIPLYVPVKLSTGNTIGTKVEEAVDSADNAALVGVYEGRGPAGSSGSPAAAVAGDYIYVTSYGVAQCNQNGGTPTVDGESLQMVTSVSPGRFGGSGTPGTGAAAMATCLEAISVNPGVGPVFVRFL